MLVLDCASEWKVPGPVHKVGDPECVHYLTYSVYGHSQLGEDSLHATDRDISSGLVLRIYNLAMINDQCVTARPLASGPAEFLREGAVGIGHEELRSGQ